MPQVRAKQRKPGDTCPLCQDDLGEAERYACECGVAYHSECVSEMSGRCVPGCERTLRRAKRRAFLPRLTRSERRRLYDALAGDQDLGRNRLEREHRQLRRESYAAAGRWFLGGWLACIGVIVGAGVALGRDGGVFAILDGNGFAILGALLTGAVAASWRVGTLRGPEHRPAARQTPIPPKAGPKGPDPE